MTKLKILAIALLAPAMLPAGPTVKVDPVAEGYPAWQGVTAKNYIAGREICPSDLRHKVTVVIEVEPNAKLRDQLVAAAALARKSIVNGGEGIDYSTWTVPRNVIAVVSCRGFAGKGRSTVQALLTPSKDDADHALAVQAYRGNGAPVYEELTFAGAPDAAGKRPFVYVMGPTGKEPICQGPLNDDTIKAANAAIAKGVKEIGEWDPKWRPFYGTVAEPKFNTSLTKALEKGKTAKKAPLDPVAKALLSDVKSKDEARAKEAQILYDAIEQTRDDLILRIQIEAPVSPHCAYADIETLMKHWPMEKKRVEEALQKFKANPELEAMGKMYCKTVVWSDPAFTCKNAGEAKKIVQELGKMKKFLAKQAESKNLRVQNTALLLGMKVDELITAIPTRVPSKE